MQTCCDGHAEAEEIVEPMVARMQLRLTSLLAGGKLVDDIPAAAFVDAAIVPDGMHLVGVGAYRAVFGFECGQHVLKVEPQSSEHTAFEVGFWRNASDEIKEMLCPVLTSKIDLDHAWSIHPRCEPLSKATIRGVILREIAHPNRALEALALEIGDLHVDNIGFLEDRLVALDYGLQREIVGAVSGFEV